jgi:heat shock protein HtpX
MERVSFHDQISRNKWKSFFLIILIFLVFAALGVIIGFALGMDYFFIVMIVSIVISILYLLVGYYNSDKIALAAANAKPASFERYRQYHHSVEGLSLASGLPKPRLYIMEDSSINAFASGRDPQHAVICVTTGALEKLDKQELEGVLGHELSHIANYDIRFMTLTAVLVGMIAIISQIFLRSLFWRSIGGGRDRDNRAQIIFILVGILLAILAPIFVQLVQMTISRKREYAADASSVKFIRSPTGLIRALKKIENEHPSEKEIAREKKQVSKAIAPLFISDPFKKRIQNAFSTHPPIKKRIEILERM